MIEAVEACILDLDGTLIDSEPNYLASDRDFLAAYGIDFDDALNASTTGMGADDFFRTLEDRFPLSPLHRLPVAERLRRKDDAYIERSRGRTRAFPYVDPFLAAMESRGVKIAIASGSSPRAIERTLAFAGLEGRIAVRVSASEVARGKPAPDVFLESARRLGADPDPASPSRIRASASSPRAPRGCDA